MSLANDLAAASELRESASAARRLEAKLLKAGKAALSARAGALAQGIELCLERQEFSDG